MTLLDLDKKELHDIYSSLQYTRLEIGFANEQEEELLALIRRKRASAKSGKKELHFYS